MDPKYLAQFDSSELATSRGSGLEERPLETRKEFKSLVKDNGDFEMWRKHLVTMPRKQETHWKEQMDKYLLIKDL